MSTSYPGGLDNFSNPSSIDSQNSVTVPHSEQHTNANDAIEAIEAALGTLPQGGFDTVRERLEDIETDVAALGSNIIATMLDGSITTSKLANSAVTEGKLANDSVSKNKIQSGAVSSGKIENLAVSTGKIADGAVTYEKMAPASKLLLTREANQSIGGTAGAYISWDTKPGIIDTEGFVVALPSTTITIPTGKDGVYNIVAMVEGFSNHANDYVKIEITTSDATPSSFYWKSGAGANTGFVSAISHIVAGGTVKVYAYNGSAGTLTFTGRCFVLKQFDS